MTLTDRLSLDRYSLPSLVAQLVKNLPAVQETWVWTLGREDPLEKEIATHSSTLTWRIPWTEELGYSPWNHKDSDTTMQLTLSLSLPTTTYMIGCRIHPAPNILVVILSISLLTHQCGSGQMLRLGHFRLWAVSVQMSCLSICEFQASISLPDTE